LGFGLRVEGLGFTRTTPLPSTRTSVPGANSANPSPTTPSNRVPNHPPPPPSSAPVCLCSGQSDRNWGLGFRIQDLGFRIQGAGFRVEDEGKACSGASTFSLPPISTLPSPNTRLSTPGANSVNPCPTTPSMFSPTHSPPPPINPPSSPTSLARTTPWCSRPPPPEFSHLTPPSLSDAPSCFRNWSLGYKIKRLWG